MNRGDRDLWLLEIDVDLDFVFFFKKIFSKITCRSVFTLVISIFIYEKTHVPVIC